jgi:hypothetical protein
MNPNYFYDLKYFSPYMVQAYEYSRHDSDNCVDLAVFYHDDLWTSGLLDESSAELIEQYRTVPLPSNHAKMALEFDCGSKKPALFSKLIMPTTSEFNRSVLRESAAILGINDIEFPAVVPGMWIEDVGIFPERSTSMLRMMARGPINLLEQFVKSHAGVDTEIFKSIDHLQQEQTGLNFDWNGASVSNITIHSPILHSDDVWVKQCRLHCEENVTKILGHSNYSVTQLVKVGLSDNFDADYMKAYFIIRLQK